MEIVFTKHAEERLRRRQILREDVIDTLRNPDKTLKKHGKYYFQKKLERGIIEIVCEKTEKNIKVITIYWL